MHKPTLLNGYRIYPFENFEDLLDYLGREPKNWKNILVALNAEKLMNQDQSLKNLVNNNIGYPDGIGAVLALKRKGITAGRIPGAELWLEIIKHYHKDKSFYLVGGKSKVIKQTVNKLKSDFPEIDIVNYHDGYMNEAEQKTLIADVVQKKPDVVYVAMGSPRQEHLMQQMYKVHPALYMGLGGSFDIYCELKERAPEIFQKSGFEWFYRLVKEPSRIRRQIVYIPFLLKVLRNKF